MRTVKIACLYPVKVDATWKVPGIEASAVRAGTQFFLHETSHLSAQHIIYDKQHYGIFRKIEKNLRRRIEGIGKVLPEGIGVHSL